jgi:hypothetical protein
MKAVSFTCRIQFDSNSKRPTRKTVEEAVELINLTLQREPYDLGAQVILNPDDDWNIEVENIPT